MTRTRSTILATLAATHAVACHTIVRQDVVRPGKVTIVEKRETVLGHHPTIEITDAGALRFVERDECAAEEVTEQTTTVERHREPNLAAFVVGVVATSVGGIATGAAAAGTHPAGSPVLYGGLLGLAVGLPLAIGPWLGRTTDLEVGAPLPPVRRPAAPVACGERAIAPTAGAAGTAVVTIDETDVYGTVDRDGVFSISPYAIHDAFGPSPKRAWNVSASIDVAAGQTRVVPAVIDGNALGAHAAAWLAKQAFDRRIEPLRMVPGLEPGTLRVSLTQTAGGPALRVVLAIKNVGPGEAWAVRGQIASPVRAIDRRMLYVGHVARGDTATAELVIPVGPDVASIVRNTTILVSVELRDGHGTAPTTPVRFNGQVLVDLPRS